MHTIGAGSNSNIAARVHQKSAARIKHRVDNFYRFYRHSLQLTPRKILFPQLDEIDPGFSRQPDLCDQPAPAKNFRIAKLRSVGYVVKEQTINLSRH